MKKLLVLTMALVVSLTLASCGGDESGEKTSSSKSPETTTSALTESVDTPEEPPADTPEPPADTPEPPADTPDATTSTASTTEGEVAPENSTLSLEVFNYTELEITTLTMSVSNANSWSENLLTAPITYGGSSSITFPINADSNIWDFNVADANGNELSFNGTDLTGAANGATLSLTATESGDIMAMIE